MARCLKCSSPLDDYGILCYGCRIVLVGELRDLGISTATAKAMARSGKMLEVGELARDWRGMRGIDWRGVRGIGPVGLSQIEAARARMEKRNDPPRI